jgi:small-conductance mechanosensitive channel
MKDILNWFQAHGIDSRFITALASITFLYIVVRLLQRTSARYVADSDTRYRTRKAVSFAGYLIGILILVGIFSDRMGQLTVAFGVAGAGIAFALQEVIASVAGWVVVSFGSFYKTGDRVQLGGIRGDVIDIGILRTTLMECGEWVKSDRYNGRIVRVANSFVFKEPVFNYSGDFPFLWDELSLAVKFGSDYKLARIILQDVGREVVGDYAASARTTWQSFARKYRIEEASVEPTVTAVATDAWMAFTLRYIVDYKSRMSTKDRLFSRIFEEIDRSQGKVNIAAASFELAKIPTVEVSLHKD